MRRLIPFLIAAVGIVALGVTFTNGLTNPLTGGPIETRLGLDLRGGLRGEYRAITPDGSTPSQESMETIRTIIENRVNATGVAEPIVQTQGADRITVEIPGVSNEDEVRELIGSTGRLDFVALPPERYGTDAEPLPDGTRSVPAGTRLYEQDPALSPLFGGEQLASAAVGIDQTSGQRVVQFELRDQGRQLFGDYTTDHTGEFFAIVLDGEVVSAPSINEPITGGSGQITGDFGAAEANSLVTTLRYGALPLEVEEVSFNSLSATLGLDFLRQSILAGLIGISLVFAFMLIHYRLPGVIACAALIFYGLVVFAIFRLVPVTLTLAGVAGFILSVGMAVDANVLIFERMKEELRAGKTVNSAVEAGFNRAWNSILDSNVSSLITAVILLYFGSSVIRGFALVLIIGVLVSMFTAITLSRAMLRWVVRQQWARRASLYGVEDDEFTVAAPRGRSREAGARV